MTDNAAIVRDTLIQHACFPTALAALDALVAELTEAKREFVQIPTTAQILRAEAAEAERDEAWAEVEVCDKALVAAEAERDEARVIAKRMSRTPAGDFDDLKRSLELTRLELVHHHGERRQAEAERDWAIGLVESECGGTAEAILADCRAELAWEREALEEPPSS